jgi:predicted alpha/beta superfamily hydrolase
MLVLLVRIRAAGIGLLIAGACCARAESSLNAGDTRSVQFVVSTPAAAAEEPPEIFCSGSLDRWPEGGRKLPRVAPGLYAATFELPAGAKLEYKFLRGQTWSKVEKGPTGEELPNRELDLSGPDGDLVVIHVVARWADETPPRPRATRMAPAPAAQRPQQSTRTGDIRVHADFESPQLLNKRTVLVWLPPGYDDHPDQRYPVLYMHDGNNVFDARTAFAGIEWAADETATRLIAERKMWPAILVAIYNTPARIREYTPVADPRYGGGEGDNYLAFLVETLKPFIDRTYRTRPERESTGIAGSSLGGLISLYAALKRPDTFGFAGVVSPALGWSEKHILGVVGDTDLRRPIRIWIDIGTAEGEDDDPASPRSKVVDTCRELATLLEVKRMVRGNDFIYEEIPGGKHNEAAWAARLDRMLMYLLPPTNE